VGLSHIEWKDLGPFGTFVFSSRYSLEIIKYKNTVKKVMLIEDG
jgi:hypothetical protein